MLPATSLWERARSRLRIITAADPTGPALKGGSKSHNQGWQTGGIVTEGGDEAVAREIGDPRVVGARKRKRV